MLLWKFWKNSLNSEVFPIDLDVAGELITNICGGTGSARSGKGGTSEKDALNGFAQKVMGSIDR